MDRLKRSILSTVPIRLFSDREAWVLFRLAAFSEAIGWTTLIAGIVIKHFWTPGIDTPVRIAGEVHGTIFLFYLATVVITAGSMKWSYGMTFIAGLASIPPYGTLVLEQILARTRHSKSATTLRQVSVRAIIISNKKLLCYQPKDAVEWRLPGGNLGAGEPSKLTLEKYIHDQTGVKPLIGDLAYIYERHAPNEQIELFFYVKGDFTKLRPGTDVDEIKFIDAAKTADLKPIFLQTSTLTQSKRTAQFISDPE
jgi:integral membrane protein